MRTRLFYTLLTVGAVATAPIATGAEDPMVLPIKRLTLDTAVKIAQATVKKCRSLGVNVAVTVVDRGGHSQVVLRDTLAMDLTLRISRDKAYSAMSFNSNTGDLENRFKGPGSVAKAKGVLTARGGLPINVGGTIIGGIGVSGAPSGKTDEQCAKAGLNSVLADLEMSM